MKRKIPVFILTLCLAFSCSVGALAATFKDVKDPSWYSDSVTYAVDNGYMAGMGHDLFAPSGLVTRAQLTQILYAAEGKPETDLQTPFVDVPTDGKWYSDAVLWGADNKIVAGYPDKAFRPNQPVTREQLVSVIYKYAIYKKYAEENDGGAMGLAGFSDGSTVASYARPGMIWAVQNGIISGTKVGLEPKGNATRAQMAVIIRAFMTKVANQDPKEDEPAPSDETKPSPNPDKDEDAAPVVPDGSSKDNSDNASSDDGKSDSSSSDNSSSSSDNSGGSTDDSNSSGDNDITPVIDEGSGDNTGAIEDEGPFVRV